VITRFAHGSAETSHPSYQAWSYAALINGFNEAVYNGNIKLNPCAYLHNYKDNGVITLFGSEPFSSLLRTSNIKMFRHEWVWYKDKSGNFMNCKFEPMKVHENIFIRSSIFPAYRTGRLFFSSILHSFNYPSSLIKKSLNT
jgi:hypothetical protein